MGMHKDKMIGLTLLASGLFGGGGFQGISNAFSANGLLGGLKAFGSNIGSVVGLNGQGAASQATKQTLEAGKDATDLTSTLKKTANANKIQSAGLGFKDAGTLLQGAGALKSAIDTDKFNKETLSMEKDRVARNRKKQDDLENTFSDVWK